MKKALILLVPALALLASCGDAIEIPDVSGSGNVPVIDPDVPLSGDVVFTATIEDLPDGSQAVWSQGETILLSEECICVAHCTAQDSADNITGLGIRGKLTICDRE